MALNVVEAHGSFWLTLQMSHGGWRQNADHAEGQDEAFANGTDPAVGSGDLLGGLVIRRSVVAGGQSCSKAQHARSESFRSACQKY